MTQYISTLEQQNIPTEKKIGKYAGTGIKTGDLCVHVYGSDVKCFQCDSDIDVMGDLLAENN